MVANRVVVIVVRTYPLSFRFVRCPIKGFIYREFVNETIAYSCLWLYRIKKKVMKLICIQNCELNYDKNKCRIFVLIGYLV